MGKTTRKAMRKMGISVHIYWNLYRLISLSFADGDDDEDEA
jgi:hypothetical protein